MNPENGMERGTLITQVKLPTKPKSRVRSRPVVSVEGLASKAGVDVPDLLRPPITEAAVYGHESIMPFEPELRPFIDAQTLFRQMDTDSDGFLRPADFRDAGRRQGKPFSR